MVKRYNVAQARSQLADLLDSAEQGANIVIERRGVRFHVAVDPSRGRKKKKPPRSIFSNVDTSLLEGNWSWDVTKEGVVFEARQGSDGKITR